jgi:hypothetical protein
MYPNLTYAQWINLLPEPYKSQAWFNIKDQNWSSWSPNGITSEPKDAINYAFVWENTIEGQKYWRQLYDNLETRKLTLRLFQTQTEPVTNPFPQW